MTTTLAEIRAAFAPARGTPAVTQGRYGDVGNLELVVPDEKDGLWVYWRNNDAHDVRPGALAGEWSAGLHFAAGRQYDAVAVLQATHGPDFLEVLARSGSDVYRTYWSPGDGFTDAQWAFTADGDLALHEADDGAFVAFGGDGSAYTGDTSRYPDVEWRRCEDIAAPSPPASLEALGPADAATACVSTIDGGRIDVVLRRGSTLLSAALDLDGAVQAAPAALETRAWGVTGNVVNRRAEQACRS